MRPATLLVLTATAVAVIGVAVLTRQAPKQIAGAGEAVLPALKARLNDVQRVALTGPDGTVTIKRMDTGWVVADKSDYPAALDKVRGVLRGLASLVRREPKTRNPQRYEKLGLRDVSVEGSAATRIVLTAGAEEITQLLIGKSRAGRNVASRRQWYVRLPGDPQVWLAEGTLESFPESPNGWLDDAIFVSDAARVRAVRIRHRDGKTVVLQRPDRATTNFALVGIGKKEKPAASYVLNGLASDFSGLRLRDVQRADVIDSKASPSFEIRLETFDGLRVILRSYKDKKNAWARLEAQFDEKLIAEDKKAVDKADKKDEAKAEAVTRPKIDVQGEVKKLNSRWRDWAYLLPEYRLNSLNKRRADFLQKKPAAKPAP